MSYILVFNTLATNYTVANDNHATTHPSNTSSHDDKDHHDNKGHHNDTGHQGEGHDTAHGHKRIHLVSLNFEHVKNPLVFGLVVIIAGLSKIGKKHVNQLT